MNEIKTAATPQADQDLVIERIFNAPRELVFKMWTEAEHAMKWWGPQMFTTPYCTIDLRVGGAWHFCMLSPDGQEFWVKGIYQEIVRPERIVCRTYFSDREGNFVSPAATGHVGFPEETIFDITFEDLGGKTKLTLHQAGMSMKLATEFRAIEGWNSSFDKLDVQLEGAAGK